MTPDTATSVEVPEFFCNEDGAMWFAFGVIPELEARLALAFHYLECEHYGSHEDGYREAFDLARSVTYGIERWKDADDPADDEKMARCEAPEGGEFTMLRVAS